MRFAYYDRLSDADRRIYRASDAIEVAYVVGHRAQGLWTPWYRGVHLVVVLLLVRQNEVILVRCDEIERPLNNLLVVGLGEVDRVLVDLAQRAFLRPQAARPMSPSRSARARSAWC